jgi:hypothetical protein
VTEQRVERAGPPIAKDDSGAKAMLMLKRYEALSPDAFFTRLAAAGIADLVPEASHGRDGAARELRGRRRRGVRRDRQAVVR